MYNYTIYFFSSVRFSTEHFESKPSVHLKFLHFLKVRTFYPPFFSFLSKKPLLSNYPYENTCLVLTVIMYMVLSHFWTLKLSLFLLYLTETFYMCSGNKTLFKICEITSLLF